MKKSLFILSFVCSVLVCLFMWTKVSLNGYKTDFYFFILTFLLNLTAFFKLRKTTATRNKAYVCFAAAMLQTIGLCIFLSADRLQVDKVYKPRHNKDNIYASITGWYKRSYFKLHSGELCGDGELWDTKVPYYFPLIEIEIRREQCHIVGNDSAYNWLFKHSPE